MKRFLAAVIFLFLFVPQLFAEELAVDLRFEANSGQVPSDKILAAVRGFRGVRIHSFVDSRSVGDTYLGELRFNGQMQKVYTKTALNVYATDAFKKVYGDWGGRISPDGPLALRGEITQFAFEENDGYQAKIGFHFYLIDDNDRILWDGHSSGIVRGAGRSIGIENISSLLSDILRATYMELLEDDKLVGVWSGRVSSTYVIREAATRSGK